MLAGSWAPSCCMRPSRRPLRCCCCSSRACWPSALCCTAVAERGCVQHKHHGCIPSAGTPDVLRRGSAGLHQTPRLGSRTTWSYLTVSLCLGGISSRTPVLPPIVYIDSTGTVIPCLTGSIGLRTLKRLGARAPVLVPERPVNPTSAFDGKPSSQSSARNGVKRRVTRRMKRRL